MEQSDTLEDFYNVSSIGLWSVAEIAYALGFTEATHFNNFFKKHLEINPLKFKNLQT